MYNGPVLAAIDRSLLLGQGFITQPVGNFSRSQNSIVPVCSINDLFEFPHRNYTKCTIAKTGDGDYCGKLLWDSNCRVIRVNQFFWKNAEIQKKLLYAALHPCEFLINMDEMDEVSFIKLTENSRERYQYQSRNFDTHKRIWKNSGCHQNNQASIVFFEIWEDEQLLTRNEKSLLTVYKATMRNNEIGGEYVKLSSNN